MTRTFWMFVLLALLSGCAAGKQETAAPLAVAHQNAYENEDDGDWSSPQDPAVGDMFRKITDTALGTPYARGGTTMGGFDCSGFVQWTYKNMGIELPRTAREQSQVGRTVSYSDLRIGDIVTFRHPRRGWHSGIYMGNDQFVHSPSRRQRVRYSSMSDPYFRDNFVAARRVVKDDSELDFEATARRLALAEHEKRFIPDEPERKAPGKARGKAKQAVAAKGKKTDKAPAKAVAGKQAKKQAAAAKGKTTAVAAKTDKKPAAQTGKSTKEQAAGKKDAGKASAQAAPAKAKDKASASTAKAGGKKNSPRKG